jgi:hypothetical protein
MQNAPGFFAEPSPPSTGLRGVLQGPTPLVWRLAIAGMLLLAVGWTSYQSQRYFLGSRTFEKQRITQGAIDVQNRYFETQAWFDGEYVYGLTTAVYPPASYALLKIVFNGLSWNVVKPLWFLASLASVVWLSRCLIQQSGAQTQAERLFVGLLPFACYATGAALGNGQLALFALPLVLGAVLLLNRPSATQRDVWLGSLGMVFALVQPTLSAPFFWLFLWVLPRRKPAVLVVCGYLALTAIAVALQIGAKRPESRSNVGAMRGGAANVRKQAPGPSSTTQDAPPHDRKVAGGGWFILEKWSRRASSGVRRGSELGGYASLPNLLVARNMERFNTTVSLLVLALLGAWIRRHRQRDLWLLLGVTAIVARFWTYHRWYDDLLLIVPMVTLFRITKQSRGDVRHRWIATALFLWMWIFLLAPGVLYTFRNPTPLVAVQVTSWIAALAFLAWLAECERTGLATSEMADPAARTAPL